MKNRQIIVAMFAIFLAYCSIIIPFTTYLTHKPIEEKLGYVPSIKLLKPLSIDQKELTAAWLVFKVMMYFGGQVGKSQNVTFDMYKIDMPGMSRILHGSVQLDPYNMDAYYFAQSFLTWDAHQYKIANDLLEYGMKFRTWDWYLPFFAGFNYAFFLKDYAKAAEHYKLAGELSGEPLFKSLAGRYMHESGQTELAIAYLTGMVKTAKNQDVKKGYMIRLKAFIAVRNIELARDRFISDHGILPETIEQLQVLGYLKTKQIDPYGGKFYLLDDGKVSTTSKFAFFSNNK